MQSPCVITSLASGQEVKKKTMEARVRQAAKDCPRSLLIHAGTGISPATLVTVHGLSPYEIKVKPQQVHEAKEQAAKKDEEAKKMAQEASCVVFFAFLCFAAAFGRQGSPEMCKGQKQGSCRTSFRSRHEGDN